MLWQFISFHSLWAMVGGYLIDFDHYLYAGIKWKMWSLKTSYHYLMKKLDRKATKRGEILHIFHTVEFWILMIMMAYISYKNNWTFLLYMFAITFIGMALHLILDFIHGFITDRIGERAISFLWWIKKYSKTRHK